MLGWSYGLQRRSAMTPKSSARAGRRATRENDPAKISTGTLIAWSSSHAAQAANVLFLGFFTIYCTDTLGLSPSIMGVVALATGVLIPILIGQVNKSSAGWSILALVVAVPLTLFGLLRFFTIKEQRVAQPIQDSRVHFRDIATVLRTNPYIWLVAAIQLIGAIVGNVGVGVYYFRYIVGNIGLMGALGILNVVGLPVLLAVPPLVRRFSVSRLIAMAAVVSAIGYSIYGVAGANVPVLVVGALFTSIGSLPAAFLVTVLVIDNATFNEWKGNRRLESVGGGIGSFAMSAGSGIAAAVSGLMLGAAGYDGAAPQQPHSAIVAMVALVGWIPAAFSLLTVAVAMLYFYRFERHLPTINVEVEALRANSVTP